MYQDVKKQLQSETQMRLVRVIVASAKLFCNLPQCSIIAAVMDKFS